MPGSKLSYEQIRSLADQLRTSSSQMDNLLNQELRSLFNRVGMEEVYAGTSANYTKARLDELMAKFPEFVTAVDDCHRYLLKVVETYRAVDQQITSQN